MKALNILYNTQPSQITNQTPKPTPISAVPRKEIKITNPEMEIQSKVYSQGIWHIWQLIKTLKTCRIPWYPEYG